MFPVAVSQRWSGSQPGIYTCMGCDISVGGFTTCTVCDACTSASAARWGGFVQLVALHRLVTNLFPVQNRNQASSAHLYPAESLVQCGLSETSLHMMHTDPALDLCFSMSLFPSELVHCLCSHDSFYSHCAPSFGRLFAEQLAFVNWFRGPERHALTVQLAHVAPSCCGVGRCCCC